MNPPPRSETRDSPTFKRMSICVITGFSSGMPLFLLINLVPAWLRTEGVDLKSIGLLALVQLPYIWKFLWSPFVDRFSLNRMGRRRSWMLVMQSLLVLVVAAFGWTSATQLPSAPTDLASTIHFFMHPVTLLSALTALVSATGDIALDAYRREILPERELGLGNSVFIAAYRVSSLVPGSLSLILADHLPWSQVFGITALFLLPGIALTLFIAEPAAHAAAPRTLREAAIEPMREFIGRAGWRQAIWILGFIFLYKIGDTLCTALATPFYLDMGYTKTEIGVVAKNAGLWASIGGGLLGGAWMLRLGIARALWIFGAVQMLSILGFAWLAATANADITDAHTRWLRLALVVGFEAFGVGVGTAAFVAFMAAQTNKAYTATQYALFSGLTAMPRTFVNASAGYLVDHLGWVNFYWLCFALSIPGMLMLLKVAPWRIRAEKITANQNV